MLVAVLAGGCSTNPGVIAREATPLATADDQVVPVDPDVRILTLSNGLTVYLRANDRPGGSAEMRLAINAGSVQEDPDQSGAAHFLEHMLFNGTTQFPANDLIATLRSFGMQFGADVNAYTDYDETVYELTVPTSESEQPGHSTRCAAGVALGRDARRRAGRSREGRRARRMAPRRSITRRQDLQRV